PLHALHLIAVAQQLEMLPGREEQHEDQQAGHTDRLPQVALTSFVDLAHDRVVANVFFYRVFERFHQATLSAALSFALRALGLRRTSSSSGMSGFFVRTLTPCSPPLSRARSVCFTMRSSSE